MANEVITTPNAPAAIGPYSQAIKSGDLLFVSGQIPLDPKSKELVEGGIEAQTERVMHNLRAILQAAGASFEDVVKTTIYLTDSSDFPRVNQVYGSFFSDAPPARATVQVAALPLGASIEIDAVARLG